MMAKSRSSAKSDHKPGKGGDSKAAQPKQGRPSVANTPSFHYRDTLDGKKACEAAKNEIADKCKSDADKDSFDKAKPKSKLGALTGQVKDGIGKMDDAAKTAYGYKQKPGNAWVNDHCKGLWVKPAGANIDKFNEQIGNIKNGIEKGIDQVVKDAGGKILDKAAEAGKDYATRAAAKEASALASLVIPGVGEIVVAGATIFNIVDGVWTAGKTALDLAGKAKEAYDKISGMKDQLGKLNDVLNKKTSPTELWADVMTGVAEINPCLQAKRCQLVPFEETKAAKQAKSGKGCCPGQTGHHLLPEEMMQDCPQYTAEKHAEAPTVCVEGVNNSHGSHGAIHESLDLKMRDWRKTKGDSISNEDAIEKAVESHRETFRPPCNEKCLVAQLKNHYKNVCKGKMKPRGGKGTDIEESGSGTNGGKRTD